MKKNGLKLLSFIAATSIALVGCDGLGKMIKNAEKVTYTVTPNPLEMHGDSVAVTVSGTYPPNFFAKKVAVTVTPTIKWNGGEQALKSVTYVGESSAAAGTKIMYKTGGAFSYSDKVAYTPSMKNSELVLKATGNVKKKTKPFPDKKIADATVVTPLLVRNDEKPLMAKDNFQKVIPVSANASIFYIVNQSNVRPSEMNNAEMKAMKEFVMNGMTKSYVFKGVNVSAYASPDGELTLNSNLAEDRAKSAMKALEAMFKEKKTKVEAGQKDEFYNKVTTAEDWDGFKAAMQASSIPDKDLVLRVLEMYSDGEQREKEIKNMAKTYTEISNDILPKLRRAVLTLNADQMSRTDEQISKLVNSNPDSLSVEEMLYAATLVTDMSAKLNIYKQAEKQYGADWRCANNVGYINLLMNNITEAKSAFERANKASANNAIVLNNLGICARWNGDRKGAADYYKSAMSAGPEVAYNMGIIDIMNGNYSSAVSNMGTMNTFNAALAKVLNGTPDAALTTLDASAEKEAAYSFYLKAIIGARTGKADMLINNLKSAISKDASYKQMAKEDMEFLKFRANADFQAATN